MNRISSILVYAAFWGLSGVQAHEAKPRPDRPKPLARYTPTVKLIEEAMPSVGSIQIVQETAPGQYQMKVGSTSVIHETGYLLTNDHVVSRMAQGHVFLPNRPPLPFQVIAKMSSEDLALIKVGVGGPLKALPLGRSNDLMLGEPVLTIGNPGGLTHSVSTGIVSGLNRSTAVGGAFLPWMIQTSAAVSGGNSGGPLINAMGEQIGVITGKKMDGENINFAIAADRVREMFPVLLSAELRYGFRLGVEVDMYEPAAKVTAVKEDSPGAVAGIKVGDLIKDIDGSKVGNGVDFHIALIDRKAGDRVKIQLEREKKAVPAEVELGELKLAEPVEDKEMEPGLQFEGFDGRWDLLPDFATLKPVKTGRADQPTEGAYKTESAENYALRFQGFIKIPKDGLYTFYTSSDDGSRIRIGDDFVVNNDGLHGVMKAGGLVRLRQGLHPVEVTFFEQGGDEKLEISWEGAGLEQQVIPAEAWFSRASKEEKPAEEKPAEEKPAEEKPAEEKPVEEKPAEEKPVEEKPVEEKPVEERPVEEKPAEKPAGE